MRYQITEGIVHGAIKAVVYGPEGIGKSTFASKFPNPLFIDTEGSTKKLNVKRLPKPTSWQMLKDEITDVINERPCKTLVLDTADWAERLCVESVCRSHGKKGIEDFGYGNGYTYVAEEWGRFLNQLQDVIDIANINVVLTAHAIIRKFEQPNEMGAYDRYELKLGKKTTAQTAPLTKEWADMVLFANYKTFSVAADDKGKKHKAQGGQRVMYTSHHPCWDAKNRDGLAEELPFDYEQIRNVIEGNLSVNQNTPISLSPSISQAVPDIVPEHSPMLDIKDNVQSGPQIYHVEQPTEKLEEDDYAGLPKTLVDLMKHNGVTPPMIQKVATSRGFFTADMKVREYDTEFLEYLTTAEGWEKLMNEIQLPF